MVQSMEKLSVVGMLQEHQLVAKKLMQCLQSSKLLRNRLKLQNEYLNLVKKQKK